MWMDRPDSLLARATGGGLMSYEVHRWAHAPRLAPRWARVLQDIGTVPVAQASRVHHRPPQDRAYCILTDWLNPVLEAVGLWRWLDRVAVG
jgi:hypothetical protein